MTKQPKKSKIIIDGNGSDIMERAGSEPFAKVHEALGEQGAHDFVKAFGSGDVATLANLMAILDASKKPQTRGKG